MKVVFKYVFNVYAERELFEGELRDIEALIDDNAPCVSWTTTHTDAPEITRSSAVGVDFGKEYVRRE